jgi:CHAT domain-containing protein
MVASTEARSAAQPQYDKLLLVVESYCTVDKNFSTASAVERSVLTKRTFQLLDLVTHHSVNGGGMGSGLQMADNDWLRPTAFARSRCQFGEKAALVVLNACSSAAVVDGPFATSTYTGRLIEAGVGGVVASTLPVSAVAAAAFTKHLYKELAEGKTMPEALQSARQHTLKDKGAGTSKAERRLCALSYCVFADPRMTVKFERIQSITEEEAA